MIALITPTGGRPKQIELCAKFMSHQDYQGKVVWIIVDDVDPITTEDIPYEGFKEGWKVIKVYPKERWRVGMNTQSSNLLTAISILELFILDAIFIIEDDDYYSPQYLRVMMEQLQGKEVVGQTRTIYYDVVHKGWFQNHNSRHASLFQVAFVPDVIPQFVKTCRKGKLFIDMNFFREVKGKNINLFGGKELAIGIKGLPGRKGIGMGHRMDLKMEPDPELIKLKELIGEDYIYYL